MKLTPKQIKVYKLCSSDFEGLSQAEAAKRLGISQQRISQIMGTIKKKCPSLFPVYVKQPDTVRFYDYMSDDIIYKF